MKLIAVVAAAFIATGCATAGNTVTATVYDPVEYGNFVQTWTAAEIIKSKCEWPAEVKVLSIQLKIQSWYSYNYTIPGADKNISDAAKLLFNNATELTDKYQNDLNPPTRAYCETKTGLIVSQAKRVAESIKRKQ